MNAFFNPSWLWLTIQPVVIMSLLLLSLSGCGGGSGNSNSGEDDAGTSSDVILSGFTLSGASLDQPFQPDQLNYSASVDFSQDSITLIPETTDAEAIIRVNGYEVKAGETSAAIALAVGQNQIDIVVTTVNASTSVTYFLDVLRASASSDASLSGLTLYNATLDQLFQPNQTVYSASVGYLQVSAILTPIAANDGATILVNGAEVSSGTASAAIPLVEGENRISLVVTAEDGVTTQSYSITLSRGYAALFAQEVYLKASNAERFDNFGRSVALSGDTLVVGAPFEDGDGSHGEADNSALKAGAVYVFTRSGAVWSQQAYLKASNAELLDFFGTSVAISGDTLVVGAHGRNGIGRYSEETEAFIPAAYAGAVYVFTRNGGIWNQQAYIEAVNSDTSDLFGSSVAISGDTLVAGATYEASSASGGEADNSAVRAGAVYVFTRSDEIWSRQAYLKASNAKAGDWFGCSVAISGDTLVVGANQKDHSTYAGEADSSALGTGAAYVFTRSGGVWNQQALLKASHGETDDRFGNSVAISGDILVVGAPEEDSGANTGWADNSATNAGAAYIFIRNAGVWSQRAYVKASNAEEGDNFGSSVAISGDTLVVGALYEDSIANAGEADNSAMSAGSAYIFTRDAGVWRQQAYLKASNAERADFFGFSVAVSGDILAVGGYREASSADGGEADNSAYEAGAVYIWQ